jgi:hypothetical protein
MSDWILTSAGCTLAIAGVAAELNLLRYLIREGRGSRREPRGLGGDRASRNPHPLAVAGLLVVGLTASAAVARSIPAEAPASPAPPPVPHPDSPEAPSGFGAHGPGHNDPSPGPRRESAGSSASGVAVSPGASDAGAATSAPANADAVSVQINLDYTTAYFYRGIIQEDSGLILQPAVRITTNLMQTETARLDGFVGTWNSFHGQKTGAQTRGDFSEYWYESDLLAGATLTVGPVALTASYTFLTSPSDAYETVQELGFTVAIDDRSWLKQWSLKPYATLAIETGADASDGADSDPGVYLELGIAPGFTLHADSTPLSISFPALIGLSLKDYYQNAAGADDTFGFGQIGAKVSMPLGEPGRLGAWTLNAGLSVLFLGDHTRDFNGGNDTEVVATIGLQWNF